MIKFPFRSNSTEDEVPSDGTAIPSSESNRIPKREERASSLTRETHLSKDVELNGELYFEKPVWLNGKLEGNVDAHATLSLMDHGVLKGRIQTDQDVEVGGKVIGNIQADGKVTLKSGASLLGNVVAEQLKIEEGAEFKGVSKSSKAPKPPAIFDNMFERLK